MQRYRMLLRAFKITGWLALLAGLLLQLWLKDRHASWAVFFYAMPKPCLAGLALLLAVNKGVTGAEEEGLGTVEDVHVLNTSL